MSSYYSLRLAVSGLLMVFNDLFYSLLAGLLAARELLIKGKSGDYKLCRSK